MKDKIINGFKKHGRDIGLIVAGTAIAIGVAVWSMNRVDTDAHAKLEELAACVEKQIALERAADLAEMS